MIIRAKRKGVLFDKRVEAEGGIDDVLVKSDILEPEKGKVLIYFKGKEGSGIAEFRVHELERLMNSVKPGIGMLKSVDLSSMKISGKKNKGKRKK